MAVTQSQRIRQSHPSERIRDGDASGAGFSNCQYLKTLVVTNQASNDGAGSNVSVRANIMPMRRKLKTMN